MRRDQSGVGMAVTQMMAVASPVALHAAFIAGIVRAGIRRLRKLKRHQHWPEAWQVLQPDDPCGLSFAADVAIS